MVMMFEALKKFIFRSIGSIEPTEPTESIAIVENVSSFYSMVENGLKDNVSVKMQFKMNLF